MKRYSFIIILLFFLASCTSKKGDIKLARVYGDYLYLSDISDVFPKGISSKDSLVLLNNFINNWVQQRVTLHEADNKLSDKEKDFKKQIDDYRNSLIIYNYEKKLIDNIDTVVSPTEMEKYYLANPDNFQLKDNIVKVYYVKLPLQVKNTQKIKKLMKSDSESDKKELEEYCKKNAVNYYFDDTAWLLFDDVLKEIPINTYNQEEYLKNNKYIEFKDKDYYYFLKINDFKIKESLSPYIFEKENIKNIIINLRKTKSIKQIEDNLYKKAMTNKDVEVFKIK
ncbi:MAG: peptidyl-prolyl cis-trans isomerase [Bacteroidota bacterium]|nr:peptidyl-prolyl cis-trans isomerase [Bacteroidota bacterium]